MPRRDKKLLVKVAEELENAGLYDLAWRAFAEVVYGGFSPTWITIKSEEENWQSPPAAEYWYKAAICAYKAGEQELAWDYLMKAAVFGTDDLYKKAQETAKQWAAQGVPSKPTAKAVDPKVRREALRRVVQLYVDMNVHPRAWALIDAYREDFAEPDKLRKEVQDKWLSVIKDVSRAANKVVLYGYEVYPDGDPFKVTVPWALSDQAMAYVKERLDKEKTPSSAPAQP